MYFGQTAAAPVPAPASKLPFDLGAAMSPVWAGLIMGITGYTIAKAMDIPSNKAAGLGLALGATLAIGEIGSSWLKGHLAKAQQQAAAAAPTVTAPVPVTPAASPIQVTPVGRW